MKSKIFTLMTYLLTSTLAIASDSWEEKEEFRVLGHNYIHQRFNGQTSNIDDKLKEMATEGRWSLQSLQEMSDTYIDNHNPGSLLAASISGENSRPDSQRTQGYVLIGLAQVMQKKLELSLADSPLNIFTVGAENKKLYGPYMHRGISHLLSVVTGRTPFTMFTMIDNEIESMFSSAQEQEQIESEDNQDTSEFLSYLVQLSYEYSEGDLISEWDNLGTDLYVRLQAGKLNKNQYENLIIQEINRSYANILHTLNQTSFAEEESIQSFMNETIEKYIYKLVNGSLYPLKKLRPVEKAIKETLDAKSKMAALTIELVKKAFPQAVQPQEIYARATELLTERWIYNTLSDAFENINGERVPVIKEPYNNVWSELVFGCEDAAEKIKTYRKKYHPNI